jgi:hypothetical protein
MGGLGPFREPTEEETPWIHNFLDDQYELRPSSFLGTFMLVLVTVGAVAQSAVD